MLNEFTVDSKKVKIVNSFDALGLRIDNNVWYAGEVRNNHKKGNVKLKYDYEG